MAVSDSLVCPFVGLRLYFLHQTFIIRIRSEQCQTDWRLGFGVLGMIRKVARLRAVDFLGGAAESESVTQRASYASKLHGSTTTLSGNTTQHNITMAPSLQDAQISFCGGGNMVRLSGSKDVYCSKSNSTLGFGHHRRPPCSRYQQRPHLRLGTLGCQP